MTKRRYTLAEIDQMRAYFRARLPAPLYSFECAFGEKPHQTAVSIASVEARNREAENQLRTAIAAGVDPCRMFASGFASKAGGKGGI